MYAKNIKIIIETKLELIDLLSKAVKSICSTVVKDDVLLYHLELCLVEAVMNVYTHVYQRQAGNFIEVEVTLDQSNITFHVINLGDQSHLPVPKKELEFDPEDIISLPESGMGLFLIYRIMDEVSTSNKRGKNILFMKKNLE